MTREHYIVGNWKMNQTLEGINAFFEGLLPKLGNSPTHNWIAPQAIHIPLLLKKGEGMIKIGVQNCSYETQGAYTGELSPVALKDLGTDFVILGHSERRAIFKETNSELALKVKQALKSNLKVIYCVGETLEQRESNQVEQILSEQLLGALCGVELDSSKDLIIAYEPVWAIGTGKTATPEMAEEAHAIIRKKLSEIENIDPMTTSILYGGSVKPSNIESLMAMENIDGALVGGAALKAEDYIALCNTNC